MSTARVCRMRQIGRSRPATLAGMSHKPTVSPALPAVDAPHERLLREIHDLERFRAALEFERTYLATNQRVLRADAYTRATHRVFDPHES
jgi:hypothetical protein